jgi:predicted MFS family arabinose efflux permease
VIGAHTGIRRNAMDVTGPRARSPSSLGYAAFGLLNVTIGGIAGLALPLFAGDARLASVAGALFNLGIAVGALIVAALSRRFPATAVLGASLVGAFYSTTMLAKVCGGLLGGALLLGIGYAPLLALSALLLGCAAVWAAVADFRTGRSAASPDTSGPA